MKTTLLAVAAAMLLVGCITPPPATRAQRASTPFPRRYSPPGIQKLQIDDAQKQIIRQAKTVFIAVQQTYKNDSGEPSSYCSSLPFADTAASVLALGGITKAASPETADISVSIQVEGQELSGQYGPYGIGGFNRVAGSSLSGEVAIKSGDMRPIRRPIHGGTGLPYSVSSFDYGPKFLESFEQCNFTEILVGILAETHGAEAMARGPTASSAQVRKLCAKALSDLAPSATTEPLSKLLQDSDESVRFAAADALAASSDSKATSLLIHAFETGNSKTKTHLAHCLGRRRDAQAVDALLSQINGNDSAVSGACASALGQIGDARAIDPLIEVMEKPNVRFQARQALKELTGKDLGDEPFEWKKWRRQK